MMTLKTFGQLAGLYLGVSLWGEDSVRWCRRCRALMVGKVDHDADHELETISLEEATRLIRDGAGANLTVDRREPDPPPRRDRISGRPVEGLRPPRGPFPGG